VSDALDIALDALRDILRREDKAWKPMQVFRSDEQTALDDARHEAWMEAGDIARKALRDIEQVLAVDEACAGRTL
jgi:vacuolar-type H+-ATPase subunit H